jgi:hypothetical protein
MILWLYFLFPKKYSTPDIERAEIKNALPISQKSTYIFRTIMLQIPSLSFPETGLNVAPYSKNEQVAKTS